VVDALSKRIDASHGLPSASILVIEFPTSEASAKS